jgi:hypothetical protein
VLRQRVARGPPEKPIRTLFLDDSRLRHDQFTLILAGDAVVHAVTAIEALDGLPRFDVAQLGGRCPARGHAVLPRLASSSRSALRAPDAAPAVASSFRGTVGV